MNTRTTRREVLKQSAAGLAALALGGSLLSAEEPTSDKPATGIKIGGVDWELKGPNNPEALAVAARLGMPGIQIDLGNVEAMRKPERQKLYFDAAKKQGVQLASLALGALGSIPLATDKRALPLIDGAIDVAVAMKQKIVLLACFEQSDLMQPPAKIDAMVARLKEIAPKAEKAGVLLGLEAECTVEHFRKILDRVGSSAVKVYFDTQHAHRPGRDIFQEITFLKDAICQFHAKDTANILLGKGPIDFREFRRAVEAIGYHGWIFLEQWLEVPGPKPLGFDETHRRNLKFLQDVFSGEKS